MPGKKKSYFAVMHIGSEQIFLRLVQYTGIQEIVVIENAIKKVFLATETFKTDRIGFERVNEVCELLVGYKRLLSEYGIKDYRLIATTALREAENKTYIIDQIRVKTGFETEILDMPQSMFYLYCGAYHEMQAKGLTNTDDAILYIDVSVGGLGFVLYHQGEIKYQQSIHLSIVRIKEKFTKHQFESINFGQALAEYADTMLKPIARIIDDYKIGYLVFTGTENALLLQLLGKAYSSTEKLTVIQYDEFIALYEKIKFLNAPQIYKIYNLSEELAEIMGSIMIVYNCILTSFKADKIAMIDTSLVDGVILYRVAERTNDVWMHDIEKQIISMVHALGRKYDYDEDHICSVESFALKLYDSMQRIHGLNKRDRMLLRIAAILHDIGKFISMRQHYIHSYRLMQSSEVMGLSEEEKETIANIIYYHSRSLPSPNDEKFALLSQREQVRISKMAAMIRMADAIDRGYMQKVKVKSMRLRGDELFIRIYSDANMSLEEWTFEEKADFFEEVFGISPRLIKD